MNKQQMLRHRIINRCLRNRDTQYTWEDLANECSDEMLQKGIDRMSFSKKTIHNDLNFLRENFQVEILAHKIGKRIYYTYKDASMTIDNQPLAPDELEKFKKAIITLSSISGRPEFDYISDILPRLETSLDIDIESEPIISYENNNELKNSHLVQELYNHIRRKNVLKLDYVDFHGEGHNYLLHPYFLKQYNSRWYLFGLDERMEKKGFSPLNIALDRIQNLKTVDESFVENTRFDFRNYFDNIIGVTKFKEKDEVKVEFRVHPSFAKYIITKPIHPEQRPLKLNEDDEYYYSSILLKPNHELYNTILSYGEKVEIIGPENVRAEMSNRVLEMYNLYK